MINTLEATTKRTTRQRILMAARELFWKQGYHATSVAQILSAAEVGSGSLYYFFKSKEDVLVGVLELYLERLHPEVVAPAEAQTAEPIERVFAILGGYRRGLIETDFRFSCPIGRIALEVSDPSDAVRILLQDNFQAWADAVEGCLRDAGARLGPDMEVSGLARFVLSVMEGAVMQAATARSVDPFDASVRHLRSYINYALDSGGPPVAAPPPRTERTR